MVKPPHIMKELFDKFNILSLAFSDWLGGALRVNPEVLTCKFNGSCSATNRSISAGHQAVIGPFISLFDCILYIKRPVTCYREVLITDVYWSSHEKPSH